MRHPASVALSYRRLGWLGSDARALQTHAHQQASRLRQAWERLQSYAGHTVVRYEDVCLDPKGWHRKLYDFGGLTWNAHAEQTIERHSQHGDRGDTYGTYRDSQSLTSAWRDGMPAADIKVLRDVFAEYGLPWYAAEAEW